MGILKRLREVEQAVQELQYSYGKHLGVEVRHFTHPIQPPAEPSDCDKCANKDGCDAKGEKCNDFVRASKSAYEPQVCKSCPNCKWWNLAKQRCDTPSPICYDASAYEPKEPAGKTQAELDLEVKKLKKQVGKSLKVWRRYFDEPKEPAEPKKYYCICGGELKIKEVNTGWWVECPNYTMDGLHITHWTLFSTEAALIAELEKTGDRKDV